MAPGWRAIHPSDPAAPSVTVPDGLPAPPAPVRLDDFIAVPAGTPLAAWAAQPPWALTPHSEVCVAEWLARLDPAAYAIDAGIAVHRSASVEPGAVLKAPVIVGPRCLLAHGACLRGGVWLDEDCIVGPGSELKSSFLCCGSRLAHFNFVGDSVLGRDVNLEAGSVIANHRNERADKRIRVRAGGALQVLEVLKFGALVGDGGRIGANAVLAPGSLLPPGTVVPRLALVDPEAA
jgi:NDP-sugar pyrophosphorylase family protein